VKSVSILAISNTQRTRIYGDDNKKKSKGKKGKLIAK